jgi:hypothetical protein
LIRLAIQTTKQIYSAVELLSSEILKMKENIGNASHYGLIIE